MTARHHHYLSQCYLKGFTSGNGKKSKLTVLDFKEKRHFETIPRNVGGIRDFNRIDMEGLPPDFIEGGLAELESLAAQALRKVSEGAAFEGDNRNIILNLLALLATRSPEMREQWRRFHSQIAERVMDLTLATEERWNGQVAQMKADGIDVDVDVTYEDMKRFVDEKAYTIEVAREHHIHMEMVAFEAVLPYLAERKWLVVRSTDETGPFITSDHPAVLLWKNPENVPPFYRNSPGHGMVETRVFFPISSKVAIIGEFEGEEAEIQGDLRFVANINSIFLSMFHKQIYCPKLSFYYIDQEGNTVEGRSLLKGL